jgi:hypothetical protein
MKWEQHVSSLNGRPHAGVQRFRIKWSWFLPSQGQEAKYTHPSHQSLRSGDNDENHSDSKTDGIPIDAGSVPFGFGNIPGRQWRPAAGINFGSLLLLLFADPGRLTLSHAATHHPEPAAPSCSRTLLSEHKLTPGRASCLRRRDRP